MVVYLPAVTEADFEEKDGVEPSGSRDFIALSMTGRADSRGKEASIKDNSDHRAVSGCRSRRVSEWLLSLETPEQVAERLDRNPLYAALSCLGYD
jgi:hypothetical protein